MHQLQVVNRTKVFRTIHILWSSISVLCTIEHHNKWFTNSVKDSANWSQRILQKAKYPLCACYNPTHTLTFYNWKKDQPWFFGFSNLPIEFFHILWEDRVLPEMTHFLKEEKKIQIMIKKAERLKRWTYRLQLLSEKQFLDIAVQNCSLLFFIFRITDRRNN